MHTTGNLVADTICRTAEIGLTITDAADAGPLTVINATPVRGNYIDNVDIANLTLNTWWGN